MGGKFRAAQGIAEVLLRARGGRREYVEPFLGGAAVAVQVAPYFEVARLSDVQPDLIMMWQAAIAGWVPPTELSEEQWRQLRHAEPSALRGFAGFGCSFGGRWFQGFGRQRRAGKAVATEATLAPSSSRTVVRQARALARAQVAYLDYRDVRVTRDCLVYADPPYVGAKTYNAVPPFDHEQFWARAASWAWSGAAVFVSESEVPPAWAGAWVEVWSLERPHYLRGDQGPGRTERLFADQVTAERIAG